MPARLFSLSAPPDADAGDADPSAESIAEPATLPRILGVPSLTATLLAVIIGAGIYSTPPRVAQLQSHLGLVLALWAGVGLLSVAGGLVWAELGTRLPVSGSSFFVVREVYGPRTARVFCWLSTLVVGSSNRAALAIVCADYLAVLLPLGGRRHLAAALAALVFVGLLNTVGLRAANRAHFLLASIKVVALGALVAGGLVAATPALDLWSAPLPSASGAGESRGPAARMALSILLIFFAYTGWARVVNVAEEVRRPRRDLWMSMVVGIGGVTVLYVALVLAAHRVLGFEAVRASDSLLSEVATRLVGPAGGAVVALLIVVSVLGSISVSTFATSRLILGMARDGSFFRAAGRVHRRYRTPALAIWLHLGIAMVLLLLRRGFTELVVSAIFLNLAFYIVRGLALFPLRRRRVGEAEAFRVPLYPWLPGGFLLFLIGLFGARIVFDWERAWMDLLLLAALVPLSVLWDRFGFAARERTGREGTTP